MTLSNPAYLPQLSMAVQKMNDNAYMCQRNSRILIKLPTPSAAAELYCNLETYFSSENVIENIRHIPLAEHSFVNCQIKRGDLGAIPFDTTTSATKLRSKVYLSMESLLPFDWPAFLKYSNRIFDWIRLDSIKSALDKHEEQPFVIDVQFATKIGLKNTETISNRWGSF